MILSNDGIREALRLGQIAIDPQPHADQYTTSAVDLVLGDPRLFRIWDRTRLTTPGVRADLNLAQQDFHETAKSFLLEAPHDPDGSVVLPPYSIHPSHLLVMTRERVCLKREARLAGRVEGRSSYARLGLVVHLTAPTIHAGFVGHITLEMINFGPFYLRLVPFKTRICQLIIERLEGDAAGEPNTAFQNQVDPAGSVPPAFPK